MADIRVGRQAQRGLPTWVVVACVLVVLALAALPGPRAFSQGLMARVATPAQTTTLQALSGVGQLLGTVTQAGDLTAQNRALRDDVRQLQVTLAQMRELEAENRDLRALLGLRDRLPIGNLIPAQVIARDPLTLIQAITIDRGFEDGVAANMPIVTDQGVVGHIVEVHATSSKALLLTDVNSAAAVRTNRPDSQANGLVRGTGDGRLLLQYVTQDEVLRDGDLVLTSGVGGVFPPGLVVGAIARVRQSDVSVFQEALVEPAVRARSLGRVYILGKWSQAAP